jgi:hypothetical protein
MEWPPRSREEADAMGRHVIVAYRPKPGQSAALDAAVAKHVTVLRERGLATDAPVTVLRAKDGTVVEIFEWVSAEAVERAHSDPAVQALWAEFNAACDYVPLASLPEAAQLFADFEAWHPASTGA